MKHKPLWRVSVDIAAESEDAVAERLATFFSRPASIYTDAETGAVTASVFCESPSDTTPARRAALRAALAHIAACGLDAGTRRVTVRRVPREDWAESWKRHFKPLRFGRALLVKPSWSRVKAARGQAVVVLDPGLSFGTGQHPTTSHCLRALVRAHRAGAQSLLDAGTGSGILAIAAARLGFAHVEAFDFDPDSVHIAQGNARRNRVADKLRLTRADLTRLPARATRRFDVVCANLISDLLIAERARLLARLAPGGTLVLAGILATQFEEVRRAYEQVGCKWVEAKTESEWRSGTFAGPAD